MKIHTHTVQNVAEDGTVSQESSCVEKTFSFGELSKEAQEKAIESFRDDRGGDIVPDKWYDFIYEDFKNQLKSMGVEVEDAYHSVSYSQGDGACFKGSFDSREDLADDLEGNFGEEDAKKIREWHKTLKSIAEKNDVIGTVYLMTSRYSHSNTMDVEIEVLDSEGDVLVEDEEYEYGTAHDELNKLFRAMADDLYEKLLKEMDYMHSDEYAKDEIKNNFSEAQFFEDGKLYSLN